MHCDGQWGSDAGVSTEPCSFGYVLVHMGPGAHIGLDPLAQMGPRFTAIWGARQRVGSELQCGRGQKWRRHRESKLRCAGETWAVAHVRFAFSNFVLNGFEFSPWAMGHEIIFVAQQFGAIHCYLRLARFHIHPLLWSLGVF